MKRAEPRRSEEDITWFRLKRHALRAMLEDLLKDLDRDIYEERCGYNDLSLKEKVEVYFGHRVTNKVYRSKVRQLWQAYGDRYQYLIQEPGKKIIVPEQYRKRPSPKPRLPSKEFYASDEWQKLRYQALLKHGRECACCGRSRERHGVIIHVDHIKPRSKYPELELDINNLQILCEDCNLGKSNLDSTDWRRPAADEIEDLILGNVVSFKSQRESW